MLHAPASTPGVRTWRTWVTDALAGALTAAVFYAEYIGLGATLGATLSGRTGQALGGLMVIGAVVVSSVMALAVRQPFVAGPRAASLAVLVAGMRFAAEHAAVQEARFSVAMAALAAMLVVSAATLLLGLLPAVQRYVRESPVALRKGFGFATAVGIVVALAGAQLDGCLQISPFLTTAIALGSLGAALAWAHWCKSHKDNSRPWLAKLAPLSMMVGVSMATLGYYAAIASSARGGLCGTLGSVGLQLAQLEQLVLSPATLQMAALNLPWWVWAVLAVAGALQGGVTLLESLTTLSDRTGPDGGTISWASQIRLRALVNLVCAPLGLAGSSLSAARSTAMVEAHGQTRWAVFFHGATLLAILFFCSAWIAKLPNLAVAVALTLVAIQMIDDETRKTVWRGGYEPQATTVSLGVTWGFWWVLALSMLAGCVLRYFGFSFGGGPLLALVVSAAALTLFSTHSSRAPLRHAQHK